MIRDAFLLNPNEIQAIDMSKGSRWMCLVQFEMQHQNKFGDYFRCVLPVCES